MWKISISSGYKKYDARCRYCSKVVAIGGQGSAQLDSHAKGKEHIKRTPKDEANSIILHAKPHSSNSFASSGTSSKDDTYFSPHQKQLATNAEVMWAIEVVLSKYSFNSSSNKSDLFTAIFHDSDLAKNFLT